MNNQNARNLPPRQAQERKYTICRSNLLLVTIISVINVIIRIIDFEFYFPFTVDTPYILIRDGLDCMATYPYAIYIETAIAALIIAAFVLCWVMSKKQSIYIRVALVLYAFDCVALIVWNYLVFAYGDGNTNLASLFLDLAFHAWVIYYFVSGISAAKKLREMPEEEITVTDEEIIEDINATAENDDKSE